MKIFIPELEGRAIKLRPHFESDLPAFKEIYNDVETMKSLIPYFGVESWTDEMIHERYNKFQILAEAGTGMFFAVALKVSGRLLGNCGFKNINRQQATAEFGIILHRSVWGQGIAQECHLLALSYGFEILNFKRVSFVTDVQNEKMQKFFKKYSIPFVRPLEDGAFYYELSIGDWESTKALLARSL